MFPKAIPRRPDAYIGFASTLGIFLEAGSPILLATSPLAQERFAIPLSLLVLPLALALTIFRAGAKLDQSRLILLFSALPFVLYCIFMGLASAASGGGGRVIPSIIQWLILFLWLPYFVTMNSRGELKAFLSGFVGGVFFTSIYYFLAGTLEIVMYGTLMDSGRMTQNLVLPGQYQLAVYVPTLIAFSVCAVNAMRQFGNYPLRRSAHIVLNVCGAVAILYTGAREGILIFIGANLLMISLGSATRLIISVVIFVTLAVTLYAWRSLILDFFAASDIRLLVKIANLQEADRALGGRDAMIMDVWIILRNEPLFGTSFISPEIAGSSYGVSAPSAHNMYIDAFLWTGLFGGIFFLVFALSSLLPALATIAGSVGKKLNNSAYVGFAVLVVFILLVSNNTNVPMRQPLTAPIFAFLIVAAIRLDWREEV